MPTPFSQWLKNSRINPTNEFLTPHILPIHEHSGSRGLMLQAEPIEELEN
jgi:hypothetical protein